MPEKKWSLYSIMQAIVGNDSGMIFGPTGSGKSMLVRSVLQSAVQQDVKVAVCDTEANYIQEDIEWLQANTDYTHKAKLQGIISWAKGLKPGYKFLAVDSIGSPAYGEFVAADRRGAGQVFQRIADAANNIQQYCQSNGAMALIVNQPTSEFAGPSSGGDQNQRSSDPAPFGGKAGFYTKEVIQLVRLKPVGGVSVSQLKMWKSRHMREGMIVGDLGISDNHVVVKFDKYQGRRPDGYPETRCSIPNPAMKQPEESEDESRKEPDTSPEIPIEEGEGSGNGFVDGDEELKPLLEEIARLVTEKEISEIQFKALMASKGVEIEFQKQINDIDTAGAVISALKEFTKQK